jgi:hypothetical protein
MILSLVRRVRSRYGFDTPRLARPIWFSSLLSRKMNKKYFKFSGKIKIILDFLKDELRSNNSKAFVQSVPTISRRI